MDFPEIFRYNSIISIPLFTVIALLLIKKAPGFSFSKSTISKSIFLLTKTNHRIIFRLNFLIKALLDFGFVWYLINHLKILSVTPLFWFLVVPPFLFGLLSYFVMGKHSLIHRIIIFTYGILFGLSVIFLANMTGNIIFLLTTILVALISNFLILEFFFKRKINVFVQGISMSLTYGWLLIFVFRYL